MPTLKTDIFELTLFLTFNKHGITIRVVDSELPLHSDFRELKSGAGVLTSLTNNRNFIYWLEWNQDFTLEDRDLGLISSIKQEH